MSTNCEKKSAFDHTQHNLTISLKKTHPIGIKKKSQWCWDWMMPKGKKIDWLRLNYHGFFFGCVLVHFIDMCKQLKGEWFGL